MSEPIGNGRICSAAVGSLTTRCSTLAQEKIWCAANHWQWGPRLHYTSDWGETWNEAGSPAFTDGERSVEAIWTVEPGAVDGSLYAGIMPAALFQSANDGETWEEVRSLTEHPYSKYWVPGAAGMMFHHISVDPGDPKRIIVGGSSTGVYASYDGGQTWAARNKGIRSDHLPPEMQEFAPCVHSLIAHPTQRGRLWQQTHFGQYRSDDDGQSWINVGNDLPGAFGFPTANRSSESRRLLFRPARLGPGAHAVRSLTCGLPDT